MLARATDNTSCCNLNNGDMLREVTVKIELEGLIYKKELWWKHCWIVEQQN